MAINDVSLTAGMRANLLSLQGTVDLLNRTQNRLSSGKKVNTAIDNPTSFFASQALTSRASVIDSLKDGMGQAVQTITAADKGIKAISTMIEQAKGIAQSALSATQGTGYDTDEVTLNTVVAGNTIAVGGTTFTAGPSGVATTTSLASQTITVTTAAIEEDDSISVGGITFTAKAATSTAVASISIDMNANTLAVGGTVTVGGVAYTAVASTSATSYDSYSLHLEDMQAGNTVVVGGATYTAVASVATTTYNHFTVDFTNIVAGDQITVGAHTYMATGAGAAGADEFSLAVSIAAGIGELKALIDTDSPADFGLSGISGNTFDITGADGNTLVLADVSSTRAGAVAADTTVTTNTVDVDEFKIIDGDDTGNTLSLKNAIDARQPGLYVITRDGVANRDMHFAFSGDATTLAADSVDVGVTAGSQSAVGATTTTQVDTTVTSADEFVISGNAGMDASNLTAKINALQGANYTAAVNGATITLTPDGSDLAAGLVTSSNGPIVITDHTTSSAATLGQFEFGIGDDENETAANLAAKMSAFFGAQLGVENASSSNVITVTSGTTDITLTTVEAGTADANELIIASVTATATADAYDAGYFAVTGVDATDAATIADLINSTAATTNAGYSATASDGVLTIAKDADDVEAADVVVVGGTMTEETVSGASSTELVGLQQQFSEMLNQIDTVAADAGYKGKNLLAGETLTVKFEGDHNLAVAGFDASSTGLSINQATSWTAGGDIDADIANLDTAMDTLRQQSSQMSGNLSIITVRQDFSTNMINTLTAGSDKLTLADANEEGANMLMLQTRQTLSTTALSLSAQAAQSVLRLFQ